MPLDPHRLLDRPFAPQAFSLGRRDAALYALSLGLGTDPQHEGQLRFAHELGGGPLVLPSMAFATGWPGLWFMDPATGIDSAAVVNGGQRVVLHAPIPLETPLAAHNRITGVSDKGPGRGALVHLSREIADAAAGAPVATVFSTLFCRNDGGCGSAGDQPAPPAAVPARTPDISIDMATSTQAALLYRLNGDLHPLHADPATARAAGFERPILHGLATLGVAGHALLAALCDYQPGRLAAMGARFTAPVYPGDTISLDIWRDAQAVSFCGWVRSRNARVLDNGTAILKH
ncbi:MAG: MaoC/PaaZ C-terminal domain-containing protein [Pseudomonadota bacterium]